MQLKPKRPKAQTNRTSLLLPLPFPVRFSRLSSLCLNHLPQPQCWYECSVHLTHTPDRKTTHNKVTFDAIIRRNASKLPWTAGRTAMQQLWHIRLSIAQVSTCYHLLNPADVAGLERLCRRTCITTGQMAPQHQLVPHSTSPQQTRQHGASTQQRWHTDKRGRKETDGNLTEGRPHSACKTTKQDGGKPLPICVRMRLHMTLVLGFAGRPGCVTSAHKGGSQGIGVARHSVLYISIDSLVFNKPCPQLAAALTLRCVLVSKHKPHPRPGAIIA